MSESDDRDLLREVRAAGSALDDRPSPRVRRAVLQAAAQAVTPAANDDRAARLASAPTAGGQGRVEASGPAASEASAAAATPKPLRHWPLPLAASVLVGVIGLALFYRMPREQPVTVVSSVAQEAPAAADKAQPAGRAAALPPPADAAAPARPGAARREISTQAAADQARPVAFPGAVAAKRAVPMAADQAGSVALPAAPPVPGAPAPASPEPAPALAETYRDLNAQLRKAAAPTALARQATVTAPAAAAIGAAPARADAGPASDQPAAPAAPAAAGADSSAPPPNPQQWIERIIGLRRAGRQDDADRELAQFRKRYPSLAVPPAALRSTR